MHNIYQNPTKNLVNVSIEIDIDKLDNTENVNVLISDRRNDLRRPQVSARNPHKCELHTNPKKAIELSTPCWAVVNFISHFAAGAE